MAAVSLGAVMSMWGCAGAAPGARVALVDVQPFSSRPSSNSSRTPGAANTGTIDAAISPIAPSRFCIDELQDGIGLPDDDKRITRFDEMLRSEFIVEGYEVVSFEALNATWDRVFESSEDLFDPHTGRRHADRYQAARYDALAALHKELGCDFLTTAEIVLVTAPWRGNQVEWDGARSFFTKGISPGSGMIGYVSALSLHLRIVDLNDALVFFGTGGIQVTSELTGGFVTDKFIDIDPAILLTLEQRNRAAIRLALEGMKRPAGP